MKKNLRMVLFLLAVSTVCTLCLAGAQLAYEKAAEKFRVRLYAQILRMFDIPAAEDEVEQVFADAFETREVGATTYYIAREKHPGARVFKATGSGLWGPIEILLAVEADGEGLLGLRVLSQTETPGLGGRISEPEFQQQFEDVRIRPELNVVKFATAANEVDAVTGATKTSLALQRIINDAIDRMDSDLGGA